MTKKQTIQDQLQQEAAQTYLDSDGHGILHLSVRFGKCNTAIMIMKELNVKKVLILYPDNNIRNSWESEFERVGYRPEELDFSTYLSMHKSLDKAEEYSLIIADECHSTSDLQKDKLSKFILNNPCVLGLTGTLAPRDIEELNSIGLPILKEFTTEKAIEHGIISDYRIAVYKVPLDDNKLIHRTSKGKMITEKRRYDNYSFVINKMVEEGKNSFFMRLNRQRLIFNSIAKEEKTKWILSKLPPDEKVLVFGASIESIERLKIPCHHSKSPKKDNNLDKFINGDSNRLGLCKLANSGVTFNGLKRCIISAFNSSSNSLEQKLGRLLKKDAGFEGTAKIYIVCSTEDAEEKWLQKALRNYDQSKITYCI